MTDLEIAFHRYMKLIYKQVDLNRIKGEHSLEARDNYTSCTDAHQAFDQIYRGN